MTEEDQSITGVSEIDTLNNSLLLTDPSETSASSDHCLANTSVNTSIVLSEQEDLYGKILPTPHKQHEPTKLPQLDAKLYIPKRRQNKRGSISDTPIRVLKGLSSHNGVATPGKNARSFSSPAIPSNRIPSIIASPIPGLAPRESTRSLTPEIRLNKFTSPASVRTFSNPHTTTASNLKKKPTLQMRLQQAQRDDTSELKQLNLQIAKQEFQLRELLKIKKYKDNKEEEKLNELIEKWRDVAERASNYLLNEAQLKITRMGGIEQYRDRQKKSKLRKKKFEYDESLLYRLEEYIESDQFKELDKYEKEEILSKKKEAEEMSEKIENGEIEFSDQEDNDAEFTLEELYKQLGFDYSLVYGN